MVLALLLGSGCTEHRGHGLEGPQSIQVTLVAPADPGAIDRRLPDTQRTVVVDLAVLDADGEIDASFTKQVRVYTQFLGTLTPPLEQLPPTVVSMANGVATGQAIPLPARVFGPTTLWIDDGEGTGAEYVSGKLAGASPTLWFRDPFIADLQTPRDEAGLDALTRTPLQDKQIAVRGSRHGARGRLVVTSVFAQGYTVSDVECADPAGQPPCVAEAYDHAMVFSFSAPRGPDGHVLVEGEVIDGFAGGLTEFNGLTEIGFPQTFAPAYQDANGDGVNDSVDRARMPAPAVLTPDWFGPLSVPTGRINFERNEAGAIEIRDGAVCPLDDDYATYRQWKLDPTGLGGDNCLGDNLINVITAGVIPSLDPAAIVGKRLPKVVGILRPVSIGSFNVWIIYPRAASDLVLP
jgi:peptidoglycan hydrolase-like protein with peptidoglycan-binding domain